MPGISASTSRLTFGYGNIILCTGGPGAIPTPYLQVNNISQISALNGGVFNGQISSPTGTFTNLIGTNAIINSIKGPTGVTGVTRAATVQFPAGINCVNGQNINNIGTMFATEVNLYNSSLGYEVISSGSTVADIYMTNSRNFDVNNVFEITCCYGLQIYPLTSGNTMMNAIQINSGANNNSTAISMSRSTVTEVQLGLVGRNNDYLSGSIPGNLVLNNTNLSNNIIFGNNSIITGYINSNGLNISNSITSNNLII
jgi:hypothetical protein